MVQGISRNGTDLEALHFQQDAQAQVREYGQLVTIKLRDETNITRDSYNSIKARPTDKTATGTFGAYPVQYQPTEKQVEKAGLRERTDCLVWIPLLDFTDLGYDFKDINMKPSTVILDGEEFEIKEKARASQFQQTWLYVTLGLSKR